MTYAHEVAQEHIACRRRSGWSWGDIAAEVRACCLEMGQEVPWQARAGWELEIHLARSHEALMLKAVSA